MYLLSHSWRKVIGSEKEVLSEREDNSFVDLCVAPCLGRVSHGVVYLYVNLPGAAEGGDCCVFYLEECVCSGLFFSCLSLAMFEGKFEGTPCLFSLT